MKQGHFTLCFFVIYVIFFLVLWVEEQQFDMVLKKKQHIENALSEAMEYTAMEYSKVVHASEEQRKKVVESVFLTSFSAMLGMKEREEQELLRMYLPVLILVEEDGMFFYHLQETMQNDIMELQPMWSDKKMFLPTESNTEYDKRRVIIESLEKETSIYITKHNYIASQYGISYSFFVPGFLENTERSLSFPMIFAVFQGWPLTASGRITYENCIDVTVYLKEVRRVVLEVPQDIKHAVYYYHDVLCAECFSEGRIFLEKKVTEEEAIRQFGAIPCELCIY